MRAARSRWAAQRHESQLSLNARARPPAPPSRARPPAPPTRARPPAPPSRAALPPSRSIEYFWWLGPSEPVVQESGTAWQSGAFIYLYREGDEDKDCFLECIADRPEEEASK